MKGLNPDEFLNLLKSYGWTTDFKGINCVRPAELYLKHTDRFFDCSTYLIVDDGTCLSDSNIFHFYENSCRRKKFFECRIDTKNEFKVLMKLLHYKKLKNKKLKKKQ